MPAKDPKLEALRQQGVLNPRPGDVTDPRFAIHSFFDPRDLVQVKYEMLRRVQADGHLITKAAAAFGFSRPSFYQAQAAFDNGGLAGLVPRKRGAQAGAQAHRRSFRFRARNASAASCRSTWGTGAMDSTTLWHHGASTKYRPRVAAASKKTSLSPSHDTPAVRPDLVGHYEQLRREATEAGHHGNPGWGLALFLRRGMTAWMRAWSECTRCVAPLPQPTRMAPVPLDVRALVTTLLAGIILDLQQEATITL